MAWVEALLTKWFIEEGASDVEGFKALERSFGHQHRGQQSHSHFMRPLCQNTPRAPRLLEEDTALTLVEPTAPMILLNPPSKSGDNSPMRTPTIEDKDYGPRSPSYHGGKENAKPKDKESKGTPKEKGKKAKTDTPKLSKQDSHYRDQPRKSTTSDSRSRPLGSPGRRELLLQAVQGNMYTFMPYLHFETNNRRRKMQEAIKRAERLQAPFPAYLAKPSTADEMLIR